MPDLSGWWVIKGEDLWDMLQRVAMGQTPLDVFEDEYANTVHHDPNEGHEASECSIPDRCGVRVGPEQLQCVKTDHLRLFRAEGHVFAVCPDHAKIAEEIGLEEVT